MTGAALEHSERFNCVPQSDLDALERLGWSSARFDAWRQEQRENERIMEQWRAQIETAAVREEADMRAWEIYERELKARMRGERG